MDFNRKIVLKDGREFYGKGFGASGSGVFELVFNTSMVGYQEIISDPTNYNQMILMTYPLIGNYGITDEDFESVSSTLGCMEWTFTNTTSTMDTKFFICNSNSIFYCDCFHWTSKCDLTFFTAFT